jgi:hypothetical protein
MYLKVTAFCAGCKRRNGEVMKKSHPCLRQMADERKTANVKRERLAKYKTNM